jgi:hypothetical protein
MMTHTGRILLAGALLLLGLSCYVQFLGGNAGDKDWLLYAATLWLQSKRFYMDIIGPNPPLILWLYTLPAFIALDTGLRDYYALILLGLCVVALVIALSLKLLQSHPVFKGNGRLQMEMALLLAFVFIFRTDPSYFCDRDHIFLVLIFPYVLRWLPPLARTSYPPGLRIAVGVMAAIGFSMKPHCLIVFAGIQALYMVRERSHAILTSTENITVYAGMTIYLLCLLHFTPEYVSVILPMALQTYGSFSRRLDGLLYVSIAFFTLAVALSEFRFRDDSPYHRDIYYLVGLCFFFLCYGFSNNGWGYSYNPVMSYVLITAGWLFWEFSYLKKQTTGQGMPAKRYTFGQRGSAIAIAGHGAFGLFIVIGCIVGLQQYRCEDHPACMLDRDILQEVSTPQGPRSFVALSLVAGNWSEISKVSGAPWNMRFNCFWMLHKFFISKPGFAVRHRWILDYIVSALTNDLERMKPQVIFVDASVLPSVTYEHRGLPGYFSSYPVFKTAWESYRYIHSLDYCEKSTKPQSGNAANVQGCKFDIYYRKPD